MSDQATVEEPKVFKYKSKTDAEINELAKAIWAGQVFTTQHLRNPEDARMVFMILAFFDESHWKSMETENISLVYEYLDKAGPRSVNGMPNFMSAQYLNMEDHDKLDLEYKRIMDVMGKPPGSRQGDSDVRSTEDTSGEGRPQV